MKSLFFSSNSRLFSLLKLGVLWTVRSIFLFYLLIFVGVMVPKTIIRDDNDRDLGVYYSLLQDLKTGQPIYDPRPSYGPDDKPRGFLYPPPFAAAVSPLKALSWRTLVWVWTLGLLACWLSYAALLCWLATGNIRFWNYIYATGVLSLWPGAHYAFFLGNIDPLLWLSFALAMATLSARARIKSGALCGFLLAACSIIKIYFVWAFLLLPAQVRRKEWTKAGICAALTTVFAFLLGGWVCGFDQYRYWLEAVPNVVGQGTFNPDNHSISMAVLRVARWLGWEYSNGPLGQWPRLWLSFSTLVGPLGVLWFSRHQKPLLRVALMGATAPLFGPLCWSSYLPLLLCPLAIWWSEEGPYPAPQAAA